MAEKKLFVADKNLVSIHDKFFVFQKIFRKEAGGELKIFDLRDAEILLLDKNKKQ